MCQFISLFEFSLPNLTLVWKLPPFLVINQLEIKKKETLTCAVEFSNSGAEVDWPVPLG